MIKGGGGALERRAGGPRRLEAQFSQRGWHFERIVREGNRAVYRKSKPGHSSGVAIETFEVLEIQIAPGQIIRGRGYPAREVYPASEDWGRFGFTARTLPEAMQRFHANTNSDGNVD